MTRARQRIATASAALLVQVALVALFAHSFAPGKPQQMAREMMLLLRPIVRPPAPAQRPPPARVPRMIMPQANTLPPILDGKAISVAPTAPSALEGIGRALFGCAPERYGQLTRPEQMRCPPPGEGLARAPDLDLLSPPKSHSRDAVMWAESVAAREFTPNCFMSGDGKGADCMTRQTQAERQRAKLAMREYDYQKAQRNKPAPPPKPLGVGAGPPLQR
jgi:hypothetical protein